MPAEIFALWGEIARGQRASLFPAKQMRGLLIFSDLCANAAPMFRVEQTTRLTSINSQASAQAGGEASVCSAK
jgi:hypothetical protein